MRCMNYYISPCTDPGTDPAAQTRNRPRAYSRTAVALSPLILPPSLPCAMSHRMHCLGHHTAHYLLATRACPPRPDPALHLRESSEEHGEEVRAPVRAPRTTQQTTVQGYHRVKVYMAGQADGTPRSSRPPSCQSDAHTSPRADRLVEGTAPSCATVR